MPLIAILDHLKSGTESSSSLCPHPILHPTTTATTNILHYQQSPPTATTNQSQQPLMPPNTSIHQYHHPPWLLCSSGWLQCGMFVVGGSDGWWQLMWQWWKNFYIFRSKWAKMPNNNMSFLFSILGGWVDVLNPNMENSISFFNPSLTMSFDRL